MRGDIRAEEREARGIDKLLMEGRRQGEESEKKEKRENVTSTP